MRREYYVHKAKDGKYHVAVMRVLPNGQWWLWSGTWNRTKPACWCGESYDFDAYPHNSDDVFDEEQFLEFLQAVGEENVIIRGVKLDEIRR